MSGLPWPLYHAYAHDDWSTVWEWIDAGGDISRYGLEETEVRIRVRIPATELTHVDRVVNYVCEHYYEEFTAYDYEHHVGDIDLYEYGEDDPDGEPDVYEFTFHPGRFYFTWTNLADTSLIQVRDNHPDSGILARAWEEDAVTEVVGF